MTGFGIMSILTTWFLLAFAGAAYASERVALVIGNGSYIRVSALFSPVKDADLMASALRRVGFDVVYGVDMTKENMESAIIDFGRRLRKAGPDAEGLFYFSGHGVQSKGVNYLIPLDAPIEAESHLNIKAVPSWWVLEQMEDAKNRLNLVILDACRNNPFESAKSIGRGGLQAVEAPTGTLIAYAAAPGKVAYDGRGRNSPYSPFTEALVETMDQPGLQVEAALKQVRRMVREETGNRQQPWWASSLEGNFSFRSSPSDGPDSSPSLPAAASSPESAAYREVTIIDTIPAYLALIENFPDSFYADLARDRVRNLGTRRERSLGLTQEQRRQIQRGLAAAGFDPGPADGRFGLLTRTAIERWQKMRGKVSAGFVLSVSEASELIAPGATASPREDGGASESAAVKPAGPPVEVPPKNKDSGLLAIGDAETGLWLQIKDNCSLLDEYYKKYPNGRHMSDYWQRRSECLASR